MLLILGTFTASPPVNHYPNPYLVLTFHVSPTEAFSSAAEALKKKNHQPAGCRIFPDNRVGSLWKWNFVQVLSLILNTLYNKYISEVGDKVTKWKIKFLTQENL